MNTESSNSLCEAIKEFCRTQNCKLFDSRMCDWICLICTIIKICSYARSLIAVLSNEQLVLWVGWSGVVGSHSSGRLAMFQVFTLPKGLNIHMCTGMAIEWWQKFSPEMVYLQYKKNLSLSDSKKLSSSSTNQDLVYNCVYYLLIITHYALYDPSIIMYVRTCLCAIDMLCSVESNNIYVYVQCVIRGNSIVSKTLNSSNTKYGLK